MLDFLKRFLFNDYSGVKDEDLGKYCQDFNPPPDDNKVYIAEAGTNSHWVTHKKAISEPIFGVRAAYIKARRLALAVDLDTRGTYLRGMGVWWGVGKYKHQINIAEDFSPVPGPRYVDEGKNSAELFKKTVLIPKLLAAMRDDKKLYINLDGVSGYAVCFLEEAFGGLFRDLPDEESHKISQALHFISNEQPELEVEIGLYIIEAMSEKNREAMKKRDLNKVGKSLITVEEL